jgi:hypothetical protein
MEILESAAMVSSKGSVLRRDGADFQVTQAQKGMVRNS